MKNKNTIIIRSLFYLNMLLIAFWPIKSWSQTFIDSVKNAGLFVQVNNVNEFLHGIVFDFEGNMLVGKDRYELLKITPEGNVSSFVILDSKNKGERTHIWNLDIGPDSCIYAAAGDRILKITKNAVVSTMAKVSISGTFGALDLRFDKKGNLYYVVDNKVYKSDTTLSNQAVFINGSGYFSEGTSICFNNDCSYLYISDPPSGNIIKYAVNSNGTAGNPQVINKVFPHYIDIGKNSRIVCTPSTDNKGTYWLMPTNYKKYVTLDKKGGCTLKFGSKSFGENNIYILDFPNIIYKVDVSSILEKHPYEFAEPTPFPKKFEISGVNEAWDITFEPDGKTFYFVTGNGKMSLIYYSQFINGQWSLSKATEFSGKYGIETPSISPDGKKFFFTSGKLNYMDKADSGWSSPIELSSPPNNSNFIAGPTVASNGNFYFFSDKDGNLKIYCSKMENEKYSVPQALNFFPNYNCYSPFIAPDESYILFTVESQPGVSNIFISFRKSNNDWSTPKNLGNRVNSNKEDRACVSPDGNYLFFNREWIYQVDWNHILDSLRNISTNLYEIKTKVENVIRYNQSSKSIVIDLDVNELKNSELSVIDLNGRTIIESHNLNHNKISFSSPFVCKGVYLVLLKTKNKYFTNKIIIN